MPSDPAARQALVQRVARSALPNDELAYLPGWEQAWALELRRAMPKHRQRLGAEDLLRPAERVWVLRDSGRALPSNLPGASETIVEGPYTATLHERSGAQAQAWPRLGSCRMGPKKRRCGGGGAQLSESELSFDGRFARGLKLALPGGETILEFAAKTGRLSGAIGFTGHGARHATAGFSFRLGDGPWQRVEPGLELVPVDAPAPVRLSLRTEAKKSLELGLLLGWQP